MSYFTEIKLEKDIIKIIFKDYNGNVLNYIPDGFEAYRKTTRECGVNTIGQLLTRVEEENVSPLKLSENCCLELERNKFDYNLFVHLINR